MLRRWAVKGDAEVAKAGAGLHCSWNRWSLVVKEGGLPAS